MDVGARPMDEEMLRGLHDEHAAALLVFIGRLVGGDRALAEDIAQETLLRAWRRARDLPPNAVRPWLFTTARRLVIDTHRARSARPAETAEDAGTVAVSADDIDAALDAALVMDALRSLTPAHREVLVDCYYRGRTAAEVAAERGLPAGTVRSRLFYALRAQRLALQERGVREP
jgi:RNA polymerase sigma-70 factor (ECF subfamily)